MPTFQSFLKRLFGACSFQVGLGVLSLVVLSRDHLVLGGWLLPAWLPQPLVAIEKLKMPCSVFQCLAYSVRSKTMDSANSTNYLDRSWKHEFRIAIRWECQCVLVTSCCRISASRWEQNGEGHWVVSFCQGSLREDQTHLADTFLV